MPRVLSTIRYQPIPSAAGGPPHLTIAFTQKLLLSFSFAQLARIIITEIKTVNFFTVAVSQADNNLRISVAY